MAVCGLDHSGSQPFDCKPHYPPPGVGGAGDGFKLPNPGAILCVKPPTY